MPGGQGKGGPKIILIIIAIIAIGALAWWFVIKKPAATAEPAVPGTANQPTESLGGTIYNQASNPIDGKLPDTVAPVPNPIAGMYKNPF